MENDTWKGAQPPRAGTVMVHPDNDDLMQQGELKEEASDNIHFTVFKLLPIL
jgi:hypothetical protein